MKRYILNFLVAVIICGVSSCVKQKFDSPPAGGVDPNIKVNFSIDSIVGRYNGNYRFTQNLVVSAIVVGDDESGNLYKEIAIEDSTGGIMLSLDATYLYNNYPIGRRLFINLNGLWVVNYKGTYELVGYINADGTYGGIPSSLFTQFITPGKWNVPVVPKDVPLDQLNASGNTYLSELVELDRVEFEPLSAGMPYANVATLTAGTLTIKDCNGNSIAVYTSGYANFAGSLSPQGNGKLLAIYGTYNGTPQLTLRDTNDVQLNGVNCNGSVNGTFTIGQIRALYTGTVAIIPQGTKVSGTVISDVVNGNLSSKNMVIQDATGGLSVRFSASHSFSLGDVVTLDLSGDSLYRYNGWLEVTPVPVANCIITGTGSYITPRVATVSQINANISSWESTLVQISNAKLTGSTTYSGNLYVNDGSGIQVIFYTSSYASFATAPVPAGEHVLTCIVEQYNGPQLQIRNLSDVQ